MALPRSLSEAPSPFVTVLNVMWADSSQVTGQPFSTVNTVEHRTDTHGRSLYMYSYIAATDIRYKCRGFRMHSSPELDWPGPRWSRSPIEAAPQGPVEGTIHSPVQERANPVQ